MITNDEQLRAAQEKIRVIQDLLAHARRTLTPEAFRLQAKGWLMEWERIEKDIRDYLLTPVGANPSGELQGES